MIGATFAQTEPLSLMATLERLGLGHCYHMIEPFADSSRVERWRRAQAGKNADQDALLADNALASCMTPRLR